MIKLTVNGTSYRLEGPLTVNHYLNLLGLDGGHVAIAINGDVLDRDRVDRVELRHGDRVEIVRPGGGG